MPLARDWGLSSKDAESLLWFFIRSGDHRRHELRSLPDEDVRSVLDSEGYPWSATVNDLMKDSRRTIAQFENLLAGPATFEFGDGVTVNHTWIIDGVPLPTWALSSGTKIELDQWAKFQEACSARERCIASAGTTDLLSVVTYAYSALESLLTMRAFLYNAHASKPDKLDTHTSVRDKIQKLLPKMSGQTIDLNRSPGWQVFIRWESIRHNRAIHPKMDLPPLSLHETAEILNEFPMMAGLIFTIERAFSSHVPSYVLRSMHYPRVKVVPSRQ